MIEKYVVTKREYEVLELLATGLSNKEIAENLIISEDTVKSHVHNIYCKLLLSSHQSDSSVRLKCALKFINGEIEVKNG